MEKSQAEKHRGVQPPFQENPQLCCLIPSSFLGCIAYFSGQKPFPLQSGLHESYFEAQLGVPDRGKRDAIAAMAAKPVLIRLPRQDTGQLISIAQMSSSEKQKPRNIIIASLSSFKASSDPTD
nr:hypothetical protein Iba_chr08cCG14960 [Ipomoea batatas]